MSISGGTRRSVDASGRSGYRLPGFLTGSTPAGPHPAGFLLQGSRGGGSLPGVAEVLAAKDRQDHRQVKLCRSVEFIFYVCAFRI